MLSNYDNWKTTDPHDSEPVPEDGMDFCSTCDGEGGGPGWVCPECDGTGLQELEEPQDDTDTERKAA